MIAGIGFCLLITRLMLLIHNNQPHIRDRQKDRTPRTYHHMGFGLSCSHIQIAPFGIGETAVIDDEFIAEDRLKTGG